MYPATDWRVLCSGPSWITDISGPILDRLQREVIWPTDLFSFHYDRMVMRRTTRRASPWTIDRAMVGFHIPVLVTAVGRAYLAHQRPDVQLGVIDRLAKSKHPDDAPAQDRSAVVRLLRQVAKDGFATRALGFMRETSSIAVPVLVDRVARCSVAVTYINSALSTARRQGGTSNLSGRQPPKLPRVSAPPRREILVALSRIRIGVIA